MMQIRCDIPVYDADGNPIKNKEFLKYLGAVLHKIGRIDSEIGGKIGRSKSEFRALVQIWSHANIHPRRKIQLYKSLVLSKLLYGLQTVWLSKHLRQRIDAFHCGCLRQIMRVPHSYISRVSNSDVLKQASETPLHRQLLRQQLMYYGRLHRDNTHPARNYLRGQVGKRRRGRPFLSWAVEIGKHIQNMPCNSSDINNLHIWRNAVNKYCSS